MQTKKPHNNLDELFDSLSPEDQIEINGVIEDNKKRRKERRCERLQSAEDDKNELLKEQSQTEYEIKENDAWISAAKQNKVKLTSDELKVHLTKAKELYEKQKEIHCSLLEAESQIKKVFSQNQNEELQESQLELSDMEQLLSLHIENLHVNINRRFLLDETRWELIEAERKEAEARQAILNETREWIKDTRKEAEARQAIRNEAEARKIRGLLHFTPLKNVESILKHGLMSRKALSQLGLDYKYTDESRYDGLLDWISVSVSFPNYKMFYKKRESLKYSIDGWAVLVIKKEVLWELDCRYFYTNAAAASDKTYEELTSEEAFMSMFSHVENRHEIPDYYTTDPQAEVMVHNDIPKRYISKILVNQLVDVERLNGLNIEVILNRGAFVKRMDHIHWWQEA